MRRLTRFEYNNTVRDLLGDTTRPADAFPPEEVGNGFGNDANALTVSRLLAEQYVSAAKGLADRLVADSGRYPAALGCDPASGEDDCARSFIQTFGARAYRRPLASAEQDRLWALYQKIRGLSLDFNAGIGAVVQAARKGGPKAPGNRGPARLTEGEIIGGNWRLFFLSALGIDGAAQGSAYRSR